MYDYMVACKGLWSKNRSVKVIEDCDSTGRAARSGDLQGPKAVARYQWRANAFS